MPAATTKSRRKSSGSKRKGAVAAPAHSHSELLELLAAVFGGVILGLSAPGLDFWYLAWCGLVPWLLLVCGSTSGWQAFRRGLAFGFAYNLIYLNWYLGLHPLTWLGFNYMESICLAGLSWIVVSLHQGLIIACLSAVCQKLPICGGFIPQEVENRWCLPSLVVIPFLWVLVNNKLGNASDLLGVPWSMIEYSQYQQLPLIQMCSWSGGVGLSFLIVMANVALAGFLATASAKLNWRSLAASTLGVSCRQLLLVALLITAIYAAGWSGLAQPTIAADKAVSILQGNINIDMQRSQHRYTLSELLAHYLSLGNSLSNQLCIFPENALPTNLKQEASSQAALAGFARARHLDLVVGAIDYSPSKHPYNSAYGISKSGEVLSSVYHKRYLVPFGEYMPQAVKYLPEWIQRLTNTPAGSGFASGKDATILWLHTGKLAPLICFESLSPELVADSVRHGGQLLVNLCDLAWFHDSIIGRQMLAFSVLRAVENQRYFVLAANSGPSAVITPQGKITALSPLTHREILQGKVGMSSALSTFTWWFR